MENQTFMSKLVWFTHLVSEAHRHKIRLILKAPITTAADNIFIFKCFFIKKKNRKLLNVIVDRFFH